MGLFDFMKGTRVGGYAWDQFPEQRVVIIADAGVDPSLSHRWAAHYFDKLYTCLPEHWRADMVSRLRMHLVGMADPEGHATWRHTDSTYTVRDGNRPRELALRSVAELFQKNANPVQCYTSWSPTFGHPRQEEALVNGCVTMIGWLVRQGRTAQERAIPTVLHQLLNEYRETGYPTITTIGLRPHRVCSAWDESVE